MIKDMVVTLNKLPSKTIVMDVVVADIPPKFGVLFSRSWTSKLKGSLQMDTSYATIPVQDGSRRLYSEKRTPYVVRSQDKPKFHHIYDVDTDLASSILFNDIVPCELEATLQEKSKENKKEEMMEQDALEEKQKREGLWTMYFDGSATKIGARAGVYKSLPFGISNLYHIN